jgi:hypothetical protein
MSAYFAGWAAVSILSTFAARHMPQPKKRQAFQLLSLNSALAFSILAFIYQFYVARNYLLFDTGLVVVLVQMGIGLYHAATLLARIE